MAAVRRQVNPQWPPGGPHSASPACRSPEKHLIIAGTGRAGTSFLVRYLSELGLDTTLARNGDCADWDAEANAGLENLLVSGANLPYVVKSPWIGEYVEQILNEKQFKIDAFIVPVRDLAEAATSRVVLEQRAIHQHNPWMADQLDRTWETYGHTAGGLVYSLNPLDQARLLAVQFHQLVLKASEADTPLVFPVFPRIATDWEYLHRSLRPILPPEITEDVARAAHTKVADAAKVRVTREIFKDPGNVVTEGKRNSARVTRARPKSTTSRSGAKLAGFDRNKNNNYQRGNWRIDWRRSCERRDRRERVLNPRFNGSTTSSREDRSSTT
jgi:hypothetical protein